MRTQSAVTAFLALAFSAVVVPIALAASGDGKDAPAAGTTPPKRVDASNRTGISEFMTTCLQGNGKFLSRDFPGAIETYRRAIQLAPKHPLGHYLLGEAQLESGNLAEAEASWKQAEVVVLPSAGPSRARILFVLADVKERQKKWEEAKLAWQAYAEFVNTLAPDGGVPAAGVFPASATSRLQVIEAAMKLDKGSEVVRQRSKASADGGVFTFVEAGAPATK